VSDDVIYRILLLAAPVLVPALILFFVPASGRRLFLLFGMVVGVISLLTVSGGPGNPLSLLPLLGFGIALGALIAELAIILRRRRQAAGEAAQ